MTTNRRMMAHGLQKPSISQLLTIKCNGWVTATFPGIYLVNTAKRFTGFGKSCFHHLIRESFWQEFS